MSRSYEFSAFIQNITTIQGLIGINMPPFGVVRVVEAHVSYLGTTDFMMECELQATAGSFVGSQQCNIQILSGGDIVWPTFAVANIAKEPAYAGAYVGLRAVSSRSGWDYQPGDNVAEYRLVSGQNLGLRLTALSTSVNAGSPIALDCAVVLEWEG